MRNYIAVRFFVKAHGMITDSGRFSIDEFNAFKLYCKLYQTLYGEPFEGTKKDFEESVNVVMSSNKDVIIITELGIDEEMVFVQEF